MKTVPERMVVGYDGSEAAEEIFSDLPLAGLPEKMEVLVVTAADVLLPPATPEQRKAEPDWMKEVEEHRAEAVAAAKDRSFAGARRLKTLFPKWTVTSRADPGAPPWAIIQAADDFQADLIVVGAHGHSPLQRFLGSVSQQVLIHADCSVRIARRPRSLVSPAQPKVLVATDLSKPAEAAIDVAAHRPWIKGTCIRLMTASPELLQLIPETPVGGLPDVSPFQKHLRERMKHDSLSGAASRLQRDGIVSSTVLRDGDPKTAIPAEAEAWSATTILMGARGTNPARRFLLGSVSLAVAARATCSVEVVRGK